MPDFDKYEKRVRLSSANLLAMYGAPVKILPAPGAAKSSSSTPSFFEMKATARLRIGGAINFQYHTTTGSVPHAGTLQRPC